MKLTLLLLGTLVIGCLTSCSNPMGGPDPFDQALANIMAMKVASATAKGGQ